MIDAKHVWLGRPPRVTIVHEQANAPAWFEAFSNLAVEVSCCVSGLEGRGQPGREPDVLLLHGTASWVRATLRGAGGPARQPALVVVLASWSSEEAASLLRQAADDVVSATIEGQELRARVHAILRRVGAASGQAPPGLRPAEHKLLEYLLATPGRPVHPQELLENVFAGSGGQNTSLVRVHVARLRKHLQGRVALRTVRGVGYQLDFEPGPIPVERVVNSRGLNTL